MQSTLQFLQAILPVANFYVGAVNDNEGKYLKDQKVFRSIPELANYLDQMRSMGWCTYYACSGFEQTWHEDPMGQLNAKGNIKKVVRTQRNAVAQKAFWLDIDIKPDDSGSYSTLQEAGDALVSFVKALSLPSPTIVCSGGGLHVYFTLSEQIDSETWNSIAGMLDSCVKHFGLKVDSSRTMDAASILRPAPSTNYKTQYGESGSPVFVKFWGQPTDAISFKSLLSQYMTRYALNATAPQTSALNAASKKLPPEVQEMIRQNPELRGMFNGFYAEAKDKDAQRIIAKCPQIASAGCATEPVWMGMMTVMKCCADGREEGRRISMQDARHTDKQYYEKFDRVEDMTGGPAKCSWFQRHNPDGCKNCPFNGRITSPAELGRIPASERMEGRDADDEKPEANEPHVVSVPVEVSQAVATAPVMGAQPKEVTLYKINSSIYEMVEYEGLYVEREERIGREVVARRVRIIDQSFFLVCAQKYEDFFNPEVQYIFLVMERGKPNRQIRLEIKDLVSMPAFLKWCGNNQLTVSQHNEKDFIGFMKAYIAQLQRKIPQVQMRDNFGWVINTTGEGIKQNGFVVGEQMLSGGAMPADVGLRPGTQKYAEEQLGTAGTLDGWLAVPRFYKEHNIIWGQLGICMGFGAALMKFAPGTAKNGIVNFWSSHGGTGKTTLQEVINSIWGDPERQMVQVFSTSNARYRIMGWRCNLPICINETTNVTDYDLSNLLFEVSEGQEKDRLTQDSALQTSGSWQTITVMSANNTVMDKMVSAFVQRDAEIKRVLDIEVDSSPSVTREAATAMSRAYQNNYGHAGRVFIQNLLDNGGEILSKMPSYMDAWVNKNSKGQDERFWENTMAATIIAGRLAKAMGLIDFDMNAVEEYGKRCITSMRGGLVSNKRDGAGLFSDFLSEYVGNMLVVSGEMRTTPEQPNQRPELDPFIQRMPRGTLDIRMETDTGNIYVRASAFTDWCSKRGISHTAILAELAAKKILELPNQRAGAPTVEYRFQKRLASGVSSLAANMTRCYKVNLGENAVHAFTMGGESDE